MPEVGDIERNFDVALGLVRQAEALEDDHGEGTPAIFFDSRLYRGPLTHLAYLLQEHEGLLAATKDSTAPEKVSS